jgi:hypothetical protein
MVHQLELHAMGDLPGSYEIGAQSATNPNPASRTFTDAAVMGALGVKVEAIFQMTSVLRAKALGFAAWSNRPEG